MWEWVRRRIWWGNEGWKHKGDKGGMRGVGRGVDWWEWSSVWWNAGAWDGNGGGRGYNPFIAPPRTPARLSKNIYKKCTSSHTQINTSLHENYRFIDGRNITECILPINHQFPHKTHQKCITECILPTEEK